MRGGAAGMLFDGPRAPGQQLLFEEADARPPRDRDVSRVGRLEAGGDAKERGLPHSVGSHEPDAVAARETEGDLGEDEPLAEALRDRLDGENAHGARWQCGQWNVPRPPTTLRTIARPHRGQGSPARPYTWNSRCMRPFLPRAST